jgi:hypothetical protein
MGKNFSRKSSIFSIEAKKYCPKWLFLRTWRYGVCTWRNGLESSMASSGSYLSLRF